MDVNAALETQFGENSISSQIRSGLIYVLIAGKVIKSPKKNAKLILRSTGKTSKENEFFFILTIILVIFSSLVTYLLSGTAEELEFLSNFNKFLFHLALDIIDNYIIPLALFWIVEIVWQLGKEEWKDKPEEDLIKRSIIMLRKISVLPISIGIIVIELFNLDNNLLIIIFNILSAIIFYRGFLGIANLITIKDYGNFKFSLSVILIVILEYFISTLIFIFTRSSILVQVKHLSENMLTISLIITILFFLFAFNLSDFKAVMVKTPGIVKNLVFDVEELNQYQKCNTIKTLYPESVFNETNELMVQCINYSILAYLSNEKIKMLENKLKYTDSGLEESTNIEWMHATYKDTIFIAFRGSEKKFSDIRTDLLIDLIPADIFNSKSSTQSKVHQGFYEGFTGIIKKLQNYIEVTLKNPKIKNVVITGHSLGGSVASIAALYLTRILSINAQVHLYIYGTPHFGDEEFMKLFEGHVHNPNRVFFSLGDWINIPNYVLTEIGYKKFRNSVDLGEGEHSSKFYKKVIEEIYACKLLPKQENP